MRIVCTLQQSTTNHSNQPRRQCKKEKEGKEMSERNLKKIKKGKKCCERRGKKEGKSRKKGTGRSKRTKRVGQL